MYHIAIPSHNRSEIIKKKTLRFLQKHNIPKSRIYIFVSEEEIAAYEDSLEGYNICVGAQGIANQRMAISNFFDEDEFIVSIDDDLDDIYNFKDPIDDLDLFFVETFNKLIESKLSLAGVYPTNNSFFFKNKDTKDLRFCIGQLKLFINKHHVEEREYNLLEDYENTIKHYNYSGGVLRLNNIGLKCNYNSLRGGLKEYRTDDRKIEEVNNFKKEYPNYCSIKKSGKDIFLNRNVKNDVVSTLWIGRELNELSALCLKSWIQNGYDIDLYIDKTKDFELPKDIPLHRVNLLDSNSVPMPPELSKDDILPYSDLWRYRMLFFNGGTWLDADMFLLRRLPQDETIISSEHTLQKGAFKSKKTYVANIGVLRFKKDNALLAKIVYRIEKRLMNGKIPKFCDNMKLFREVVKTHRDTAENSSLYPISRVFDYCAVPWWCTEEIYYDICYPEKWGVEPYANTEILKGSIGIHLWMNFTYNKHQIRFTETHPYSLYSILRHRVS